MSLADLQLQVPMTPGEGPNQASSPSLLTLPFPILLERGGESHKETGI